MSLDQNWTQSPLKGQPGPPTALPFLEVSPELVAGPSINTKGKNFFLVGEKLELGRKSVSLILSHSSVSAHHCSLLHREGVVTLVDHGSKMGTYLRGHKLKSERPVILHPNDSFYVGEVALRLVYKNPQDPDLQNSGVFGKWKDLFLQRPPQKKVTQAKDSTAPILPRPRQTPVVKEAADPLKVKKKVDSPTVQEGTPSPAQTSATTTSAATPSLMAPPRPALNPTSTTLDTQPVPEKRPKATSCAGPLIRSCSLMIDLLLAGLASLNLFLHPITLGIKNHLADWSRPLLTWGRELSLWKGLERFNESDVSIMLLFFGVLFLTKTIANFFLGVSVGQMVMGIGPSGGFIWNRLGGVCRTLIGAFTWPLCLVVDAPCLLGKRTLKEVLSLTKLEWKGTSRGLVGLLLVFPLVVHLSLTWPLLGQAYKGVIGPKKFTQYHPRGQKFAKSVREQLLAPHQVLLPSNHFRLKLASQVHKSFQVVPSFQISQVKSKKKITPIIHLYDSELGDYATLSADHIFPLNQILHQVKDRSYFFGRFYPNLFQMLQNDHDDPTLELTQRKVRSYPPKVQREILRLVQVSLNLQASYAWKPHLMLKFFWENGPFIFGHSYLRQKLLSHFASKGRVKSEIIDIDGGPTLILTGTTPPPRTRRGQLREKQTQLIPLSFDQTPIYHLSMPYSQIANSLQRKLKQEFFTRILWAPQAQVNSLPSPKLETLQQSAEDLQMRQMNIYKMSQKLDPFDLADFYAKTKVQGLQRQALEEFLQYYFARLAKIDLSQENLYRGELDPKLGQLLLQALGLFQDVGALVGEKDVVSLDNFGIFSGKVTWLAGKIKTSIEED